MLGEVIRFTLNIWFVLPVIAFFVAARVLKPSYHVRFELGDYGLFKYYKNGRLLGPSPSKAAKLISNTRADIMRKRERQPGIPR